MKNNRLNITNGMKQNSASSHCRINILKNVGKSNKANDREQIERKTNVTIVYNR